MIKSRLKKARFTQSEAAAAMGLESRWMANALGRKKLSYANAQRIAAWMSQNVRFEESVRRASRLEARGFAILRDGILTESTNEKLAIPLIIPPSAVDEIAEAFSLFTNGGTLPITVRKFFQRKMPNYGGQTYSEACAKEFEQFVFSRLKAAAEANPSDYQQLSSWPVGEIDLGEAVTSVLELAGYAEPATAVPDRRNRRRKS